jgi:hypothetical protein
MDGPQRQIQHGDDQKSNSGKKYMELGGKISHLLHIDDLKLWCRSEDDLENEIKIVKAISTDINMNFY